MEWGQASENTGIPSTLSSHELRLVTIRGRHKMMRVWSRKSPMIKRNRLGESSRS